MAEIKLNISQKGKTKKVVVEDAKFLQGKKLGEKFKGEGIDMPGYEFEISGGSDAAGFPMRNDVEGSNRKKVLIASGVGLRKKPRKGYRVRKTVAGNTIYDKTAQINLKVLKVGKPDIFAEVKEAPAEGTEAPTEEKKEE